MRNLCSLTEHIMTMIHMIIFCFVFIILTYAVINASQRMNENKDAQINARNAVSYLNENLKKHDASNSMAIKTVSETGVDALVLYNIEGIATWIFYSNGYLIKCYENDDGLLDLDSGVPIAQIGAFSVLYNERLHSIICTIAYEYNNEIRNISVPYHIQVNNLRP